ncbi:uncharacterized protein BJ171DRAFT_603096 [Polychytrium aggregatum]|uniref:uncharacterized protein n=1 Tax=Polychytrium aggregatum TaxID=110093 RepID=UPI0022FF3AE1|nr:uncharacterized protein BJ171DRAFT_603096 [Polychytrium aggregatum]KAI9193539.1 hypothetical protein BJ171DRAFT_603096 [Polychytrium aggregatum]
MAASVRISSDMARLATNDHSPDIFTIVCCNECFQLALDLATIKTLLRVCKRAHPLLSSKVARLHSWCRKAGLCRPDRSPRIVLTPSDQISLSLHCKDQAEADRSWLIDQADQGNASASYLLARVFQSDVGNRVAVDAERVAKQQQIFHLLEAAAKADHPMAQFYLAECHVYGRGVDQDHTKATGLYRNLAERGFAQAQIALGECYEAGEGVEQDFSTAIEWYSRAADQGCEDGRLHIVFLRGWFSFIGLGVEQSDEVAFNHWQEVSTQSTNPVIKTIATHMVGWMHYLGRGTERDEQKGIKIVRDSKSKEFPLGEDSGLAGWYIIPCRSPASHKFYRLCQLGSERDWLCKHLAAVCLINGFGTAANAEMAACIFEQLANEGHGDSQFRLGMCYRYGWGARKSYSRAIRWFRKAADLGNSYAPWMAGQCYHYGYGVTTNYEKAAKWYRRSAKRGNRYGQWQLGYCYKNGFGVKSDIDKAKYWYRKAADQDFDIPAISLRELENVR